ncbi:DUF6308 family protein [Gordonia sp. VNK21]|uniref:DUF6308 family protein n=1 Tax=Gordonia sp. VNK21 TaxID=3382483 RepID=UPI0038D3D0F4
MAIDGMRLPLILDSEQGELAVDVLTDYFHADPLPAYSGSHFERFAGGGDRFETRDGFAVDDLVAVTLLDVRIPGDATLRILGDTDPDYRDQLRALLRRLPTDLDLVDADEDVLADAEKLWSLVRGNPGVGRAKTSKLLARKRPRLLPIMDSVVVETVGHNTRRHNFYQNLQAALRADNRRLVKHLDEIRGEAGIESDISTIRGD